MTARSWYRCDCKSAEISPYHPPSTDHPRRCQRKAYVEIRVKNRYINYVRHFGGWYRYCRPCAVAVLANPLANPLEHREMVQP